MLFIPLLLVIAIVAAACGGADPTPVPEPTAPPEPTATLAPGETPQPTPVPTAVPTPTATLQPGETPTATPFPSPTPTLPPRATPTPRPTDVVSPQPKRGGILTMMIPYGPRSEGFNGYLGGWNPAYLNAPIYNNLIEYDTETADTLDIRGDIAKSWELSENGLTWTFFLHENAMWHDGVPLTATDIKFSLDDMTDTSKPRPWVGVIKPYYESSEIVDDYTIDVTMTYQAATFFPYLALDFMAMRPKHHVETGVDMKLVENILGSGAYTLKGYEPDVSIEYTRNEDYWKPGLPYLDGLTYFIITSAGTVMAAHRTGQALMSNSMVTFMTNAEALQLKEQSEREGKGTVLFAGPASHVDLYPRIEREPFGDVRVRQAMHLALHRQPFIEILTRGQGTLGWPFAPGYWFSPSEEEVAQLPGFRELNGEKHPDDIAEAKRLLAEAGFPDGFKTSVIAGGGLDGVEGAQLIADQLKRFLNIDVEIDIQEPATLNDNRNNRHFEMLLQSLGLLIIDPEDMFSRVYRDGVVSNYMGWDNARIEEIFQAQSREVDREKRKVLAEEATQIILDEAPKIGLYFVVRPMYVSSVIKNFNISPTAYSQNYKYETIWCDPECKQ